MDIGTLAVSLISGGALTYALGWIASKKKNDVDLEKRRLENVRSTIEIYEKTHDDLKTQLTEISNRYIKLTTEFQLMSVKMESIIKENLNLQDKIYDLEAVIRGFKKERDGKG